MRIVHIATECAPIAKAGGLADVVWGLSKELVAQGHAVEIIMPRYAYIPQHILEQFEQTAPPLNSYYCGNMVENRLWKGVFQGITITLIEPHASLSFFQEEAIYGMQNEAERFVYFSRAALELLHQRKNTIDILHLHDWHTALAPLILKEIYRPLGLHVGATVLTIHNLQHQGNIAPAIIEEIGLPFRFHELQDHYHTERVNMLKAGIIYADAITTVSPTYVNEIMHHEYGCGLDSILQTYSYKCHGILNGIDAEDWNPAMDDYLHLNFSVDEGAEIFFAKKSWHKRFLQDKLGLAFEDGPLVASVTRLVPQKGTQLIEHALHTTLHRYGQFVLLGSSPIPHTQQHFEKLAATYTTNPHCHLELRHDEALAHQIFAAADLLIIPSLFEPCGLTQMIAMRFGTLPLVRATGGLKDTVKDLDSPHFPWEERTGYTFDAPTPEAIDWALGRAFHRFFEDRGSWNQAAFRAAQIDHTWRQPTESYLQIYQKLI